MSLDTLIETDLVNFRKEVLRNFKEQHPHIFAILEHVLTGHKNMVGMEILENGNSAGQFTFLLDGIDVAEVKCGTLNSSLHHPLLGIIKPYVTIERSAIEAMIKDEQFKDDIFHTFSKYLPDITFKFLQ